MTGEDTPDKNDVNDDFERTLNIVQQTIGDVVSSHTNTSSVTTPTGKDHDSLAIDSVPADSPPEIDNEMTESEVENALRDSSPPAAEDGNEDSGVHDTGEENDDLDKAEEESNSNTVEAADANDNNSKDGFAEKETSTAVLSDGSGEKEPIVAFPGDRDGSADKDPRDDVPRETSDGVLDDDDCDMIELSACGVVDDLDRSFLNSHAMEDDCEIIDNDISHEEIELSSDEEEAQHGEVSVVLLRRPPIIDAAEDRDETIEILDSDEEFPVCIVEGDKQEGVNIEEKQGFIKEFIEREGLGIIYSDVHGLVLFHLSHVWIDGQQLSASRTRDMLQLGQAVSFYDQTFSGDEFIKLSQEKVLHQAIVVWTGDRPGHLMKTIDTLGLEYQQSLTKARDGFMLYLNGEVFLPLALVRVKGIVSGYISDRLGIIEAKDEHRNIVNIVFHTEDVYIFKKPLRKFEVEFNTGAGRLLPVGLAVSVDARGVTIAGVANLEYQAVSVMAGSWPQSPHPTLLPGGPGSYTQAYDVPPHMTFYYMELSLEAKLGRKLDQLRDELRKSRGEVVFMWRNVNTIRNMEDNDHWRGQFTSRERIRRDRSDRGGGEGHNHNRLRHIKHTFKAPPPRILKTKREIDDCSSIATAGSSSCGYISDASSHMSRPLSRASHTSSQYSSKSRRDWYNPGNWSNGGLRIKTEIKSEPGYAYPIPCPVTGPPLKKVKSEKDC